MTSGHPPVSVLINNYNYGHYLQACIDSALNQDYLGPIEIIVYDDGSTDESRRIIASYANRIDAILEPNNGDRPCFNQANAINRAYARSRGDYVFLLDSDDLFHPDKISRVVSAFQEDSSSVLVQHPFVEVDANGRPTGRERPRLKRYEPLDYIYKTDNLLGLFSQTSGLAFTRVYLAQVLPIEPDQFDTIWPDVRLTRQAVFHGRVVTIRRPLGAYRVHSDNDSRKLNDSGYFTNHLHQAYSFFSARAAAAGLPAVNLARSVNAPHRSPLQGLLYDVLLSREPLAERIHIASRRACSRLRRALPDRRENVAAKIKR